jgi:TctA family transporter
MVNGADMQEKIKEKNRFPFYKGFWINILIWAVIASACIPLFQSVLKIGSSVLLPVVWALGIALAAYFWLRSYCEFREDYLLVVVGPVFEKYEYRHITAIKTTIGAWARGEQPRARFALYVNRVLKRYISPRDTMGFLKLFKEKCPDAQVD